MRAELRAITLSVLLAGASRASGAQSGADGPVLGARAVLQTTPLKIWGEIGDVRLVAWDRDSIVVRGHIAKPVTFFLGGDSTGMKLGLETHGSHAVARHSDIVAYIPRRSKVSVKTVGGKIEGSGVSGWFYSVSGAIRLTGAASSVEVESMTGSLDLDVSTPWLRARTGDGHLLLRGNPQDVDAGTIGGTLDVAATGMMRGEFSSVSGDIHYLGTPAQGGIFEFTNHSGSVDLVLPSSASAVFALSSIEGPIINGFTQVRPVASAPHSMRLRFGGGGSQVTVRTFKGAIRIRPQ